MESQRQESNPAGLDLDLAADAALSGAIIFGQGDVVKLAHPLGGQVALDLAASAFGEK